MRLSHSTLFDSRTAVRDYALKETLPLALDVALDDAVSCCRSCCNEP